MCAAPPRMRSMKPEPRPNMRLEGGHPTLYRQFIANVIACDATGDVYPLPIASAAGARLLHGLRVTADVISIARDVFAVAPSETTMKSMNFLTFAGTWFREA